MQNNLEFDTKELLKSLVSITVGIEKEGLRCDHNGNHSNKPHPIDLGSKLTHPYITTDYSESLLEFVTSPFTDFTKLKFFLEQLQRYTFLKDKEELIWPASMPCVLPLKDDDINIADFGKSNLGKLKKLYRLGLGYRYGRKMQSIAGLHFNFSVSKELLQLIAAQRSYQYFDKDVQSELYFELVKNFRRHSWLLVYLFGASPVVDKSFLVDREHDLEKISKDTYGYKYATSLRMGGLGYTSNAQKEITVCFNQLDRYIKNIEKARTTPYAAYEKIGVKSDGEFKQLNANLIQIDNEYYSPIRPKAVAKTGMSALQALSEFGIEYVEVRIMDLDPFSDIGITEDTSRFLKSFLIYCLVEQGDVISDEECQEIDENHLRVVKEGRRPGLSLSFNNKEVSLKDKALELLNKVEKYSKLLDRANNTNDFEKSFQSQKEKVLDPSLTPSAKIISLLEGDKSFIDVIKDIAKNHKKRLLEKEFDRSELNYFDELAKKSLQQQVEIERSDTVSFEKYLEDYFSQIKLDIKDA